ncbi:hypothetical protein CDL12_15858 [Handroanthus impetiginosus]|uniref:Uncharacterized protein n=1 Tax=Handroanthus impetiginosus TaxID=429701 RepID=A0A2G9H209_9LAMI|nr:hypothetical protein CDL12_15858 [Handroanthus impetiginosus]
MDMNHSSLNSDVSKNDLNGVESPKAVVNGEGDGDDESKSLLHSQENKLLQESEKPKRKVQWLDDNGDKLVEILEFEPSDESDSDEEESDSCICRIM